MKRLLFQDARTRKSTYYAVLNLLVPALLLAVNILASLLPSGLTKFDLTENKLYTLSDQTVQLLDSLAEPVEVFLLAQEGQEDGTLVDLLEKYGEASEKVKISVVDPVKDPTFLLEYDVKINSGNSILVAGSQGVRVVEYYDIYDYEETLKGKQGGQVSFDGEGKITAAIQYAVSPDIPVFYMLTGKSGKAMPDSLQNHLGNQNISLASVDLETEKSVPGDAAGIILYAPESDLTAREKESLLLYLHSGGSLLLLTDLRQETQSNLESLLTDYGVGPAPGLVMEGDNNLCLPEYPYYLLPILSDHQITKSIIQNKKFVLAPLSQAIGRYDNGRADIAYTPLLRTSEKAWLDRSSFQIADTEEPQENVQQGPFNIAVAIEEGETRILWFTSAAFFDETVDNMAGGANSDLVTNGLNWLGKRRNGLAIGAKTVSSASLVLTSSQAFYWSLVYAVILPAAVLLTGLIVWLRRRSR